MVFEDYAEELEWNRARHNNRKGRYHVELRPRVDEMKVPRKREKNR
jgi:hypothetical protein